MHSNGMDDTNKVGQPVESNPLMEVYNPTPLEAGQPARFYWQEPGREKTPDGASADGAVQAAFEN